MQTDRPFASLECTVIRESLELTPNEKCFLLVLHRPLTTLLSLNRGIGGCGPDAVFLPYGRGNHVPIKWRSGRGPTGLTLTLLLCGAPQGLGYSYNL